MYYAITFITLWVLIFICSQLGAAASGTKPQVNFDFWASGITSAAMLLFFKAAFEIVRFVS